MVNYWLVVPNEKQPTIAVNFEVFGEVRTARTPQEVTDTTEQQGDPMAIVIGVPTNQLHNRVAWFRHHYPHSRLYLAGYISPMQLGGLDITSVVRIPLSPEFVKRVRAELDIEEAIGHPLPPLASIVPTSSQVSQKEEKPTTPVGKEQVIVVLSGKGGEGKTTISAQLGVLLAKRGIPTLIIDADWKGNQSEWFRGMNQPPIHSILDFKSEVPRDDRALLESFLMERNGLKILPCPPVEVGPIPPEVLECAIQAYKPFYSAIILDMQLGFSPELRLASRYANKFIAVVLPSAKRLRPFSMTISQLLNQRINRKHLFVVVNGAYHSDADIRKVRTGIQDVIGETFDHYYALPYVDDLSYDDDPEFLPIRDMKSSEPYPVAFLRMAEAVVELSLRKGKEGGEGKERGTLSRSSKSSLKSKGGAKSKHAKRSSDDASGGGIVGMLSKWFHPAPKKSARKGGKRKR